MRYTIDPGMYTLGSPDEHAPVLVTANFKISFDRFMESLPDLKWPKRVMRIILSYTAKGRFSPSMSGSTPIIWITKTLVKDYIAAFLDHLINWDTLNLRG